MKQIIKNSKKYWHYYILIFFVLCAVFFRFYNYPFRYGLGEETVRDAVIGIEGARELQAPLVGAFSSAGAFTFGPLFYYQLILFHLLVPISYSAWIYLSMASVICVYVLYKIGELVEGKRFGLILAFFGVLSPALIIAGTHLTTQNLTNVYALVAVWLFLKLSLKRLSYWWNFIFGIILGIGVNLHYQMSGLLILPFVLMLSTSSKLLRFVITFIGIAVTFIPLLFFDLNNHWFTYRNMLYYLQYGKNAIYVPNRWLFYLRDFWPAYWADVLGVPQIIAWIIIIVFSIIILWQFKRKILPSYMILLLLAFLFNFVLLRYYWGPRFFGYLNFLRPFVFVFSGYAILQLNTFRYGKYILPAVITFLFICIIPNSIRMISKDPQALSVYAVLRKIEHSMPNNTFQVFTCSKSKNNTKTFAYSLVFLLDGDNKITGNGIPLGVNSEECIKLDDKKEKVKKITGVDELVILPDASAIYLSQHGWKLASFKTIYAEIARWWFIEQP